MPPELPLVLSLINAFTEHLKKDSDVGEPNVGAMTPSEITHMTEKN